MAPRPCETVRVPHNKHWVLLKDVIGHLFGNRDNRAVVVFLPCSSEACSNCLYAKNLQTLLLQFTIFVKFAKKGSLSQLLKIGSFAWIGYIPTIFRLKSKCGIVLLETSQFLE